MQRSTDGRGWRGPPYAAAGTRRWGRRLVVLVNEQLLDQAKARTTKCPAPVLPLQSPQASLVRAYWLREHNVGEVSVCFGARTREP